MFKAPFTPEIIKRFDAYQNAGYVHPYTCGNCPSNLKMDSTKIYCPNCDYTQESIHILPNEQELKDLNPFPFLNKDN